MIRKKKTTEISVAFVQHRLLPAGVDPDVVYGRRTFYVLETNETIGTVRAE